MDSRISTKMKYSQASGSIPPDSRSSWDEIPGKLHQHSVYASDMLHWRRIPHIPIKILAGVILLILTTMSCKLSPKQLALTMVSETTTAQYQFDLAVASAIAKTEWAKSSSSPTERPRDLDIQPFSLATPIPSILSPSPSASRLRSLGLRIVFIFFCIPSRVAVYHPRIGASGMILVERSG